MIIEKSQPFFLNENKQVLFFDIFLKNNIIYLILPIYLKPYDDKDIKITYNDNILNINEKIVKFEYEPIMILKYGIITENNQNLESQFESEIQENNQNLESQFESEIQENNIKEDLEKIEINVEFGGLEKTFNLTSVDEKKKYLTLSTIFLNDHKLINIFYNYYIEQGVEHFYLYYNGKLNEDIIKEFDKDNITLIEWPFDYWIHKSKSFLKMYRLTHHAQMGSLNHALYKYGKDFSEYMIFNDFDEYFYIPNITLYKSLKNNNYDVMQFCNRWSSTLDNKIPDKFPRKFKTSKKLAYRVRSKNIFRCDLVEKIGIHHCKYFNKDNLKIKKNLDMFHFYNWTQERSPEVTHEIIDLSEIEIKIGISGLGFVGGSMLKSFQMRGMTLNKDLFSYDKFKNGGIGIFEDLLKCDVIFTALPTIYNDELGMYDKTPIRETFKLLKENNYQGIIVIKSTVEPETTNKLSEEFGLKLIHNPEFLTARTAFEDFHNQKHIVLGKGHNCSDSDVDVVKEFYMKYYPNAEISLCTALESESMKCFVNCFYSVKVQFFTELYCLCQKNGCDYTIVKDIMLKNKWINPMHTNVPGPDGQISYGGLCFPKDTNALNKYMKRENTPNKVLEACIEERNEMRKDNQNCE